MAQVVRVQVIMNPSASPREHVINTWHCETFGGSTTLDAATEFVGDLSTFYTSISGQFSNELSGVSPLARCFDLSEPKPRQPIAEIGIGSLSTASSFAARELCVCLSYRTAYVSGVSPKRKRGRIYLGPMGDGGFASTTGLVASGTRTAIATAAGTLLTNSNTASDYRWVVYSPTTDVAGTGGAGSGIVIAGWVDDNPDIQRRRSVPGYGANKSSF